MKSLTVNWVVSMKNEHICMFLPGQITSGRRRRRKTQKCSSQLKEDYSKLIHIILKLFAFCSCIKWFMRSTEKPFKTERMKLKLSMLIIFLCISFIEKQYTEFWISFHFQLKWCFESSPCIGMISLKLSDCFQYENFSYTKDWNQFSSLYHFWNNFWKKFTTLIY